MLRSAATTIAVITLISGTAFAQGNGRNSARNQGIPPGQMPPAGQCRVWHEGRAPGQQPRATSCNEAERIASRSNTARVIYGSDVRNGRAGRNGQDDRYGRDDRYGQDDRYGTRSDRRDTRLGFDRGYQDGITKAQEDTRDGDRYDPARHDWYKSGDRGYNNQSGSREDYRTAYRSGFVQGYDNAYRQNGNTNTNTGSQRTGSIWERITGSNDR